MMRADLRLGAEVTVAFGNEVRRATVTGTMYCLAYRMRTRLCGRYVTLDCTAEIDDEGLTWCRGWKGSQVEALRAVVALRA